MSRDGLRASSLLWPGAGLARVERLRAGVYRFLKGAPSPASPVVAPVRQALVRMLTWPIISAGK